MQYVVLEKYRGWCDRCDILENKDFSIFSRLARKDFSGVYSK